MPRRVAPLVVLVWLALGVPARAAELPPEDRTAHAEAAAAVAKARTSRHRAHWKLELPAEATVVPARYTVALAANYVDHAPSARVISVERGPGRAVVEQITADGVLRGELPVAALDAWLRTTQHLRRASQTWRSRGLGDVGLVSASHVPYRSIVVRPADPAAAPLLTLEPQQPIHRELDSWQSVEKFAHTWAVRGLERLVRVHLGPAATVPVDDQLRSEVLARFTAIKDPLRDDGKAASERARTEAVLYAHLLGEWLHRPAIGVLRERGFPLAARRIELLTAPEAERVAALAELLCAGYEPRRLALKIAAELGARAERPLLAALRCPQDEYALAEVVAAVEVLPRSAAVGGALRGLAARLPPDRVKVAVDRALLLRERDGGARARLMALADRPLPAGDPAMSDVQRLALAALVDEAREEPPRRAAVLAVVHRVLASIPPTAHETYSGMDALAGYLGELGGPDDLPALRSLLATQQGSVVVTIIHAIARHDVAAAVVAARSQISRYARGAADTSYGWQVGSYQGLLLRADARAALPELREAQARLRREDASHALERRGHRALIDYLSLRAGPGRTARLLEYVVATGELDADVAAVLRARHPELGDAEIQRALAANRAAWNLIDTPW